GLPDFSFACDPCQMEGFVLFDDGEEPATGAYRFYESNRPDAAEHHRRSCRPQRPDRNNCHRYAIEPRQEYWKCDTANQKNGSECELYPPGIEGTPPGLLGNGGEQQRRNQDLGDEPQPYHPHICGYRLPWLRAYRVHLHES